MKKTFLLLTILLTFSFLNAYRTLDYGEYTINLLLKEMNTEMGLTKINRAGLLEEQANRLMVLANKLKKEWNEEEKGLVSGSCEKISQTLWDEKTGQDVLRLQKFLNSQNIKVDYFTNLNSSISENGIYNLLTNLGVKRFQAMYGIKQTGAVGPITLAKINSMICGKTTVSKVASKFTWNIQPAEGTSRIRLDTLFTDGSKKSTDFELNQFCEVDALNKYGLSEVLKCSTAKYLYYYSVFKEGNNYVIKSTLTDPSGVLQWEVFKQISS